MKAIIAMFLIGSLAILFQPASAQVKVNLIDFPFGGDSLVADTQEELDERLLKLISHKKVRKLITWQRYEEGNAPKDCIVKRQTREMDGKFSNMECAITDAFKVVPDTDYATRKAAKGKKHQDYEALVQRLKSGENLNSSELSELLRNRL